MRVLSLRPSSGISWLFKMFDDAVVVVAMMSDGGMVVIGTTLLSFGL